MAEQPKIPRFPGGPDPDQPVPRDPVDGVDLRACAAITAHLTERREPRKVTLARFGMDEARWLHVEKTWLLRIAVSAMGSDLSLGEEYDRAFLATRGALRGQAAP